MAKRVCFGASIHAAVPKEVANAIDIAAGRELISPSAFVRRAVQRDLLERGLLTMPVIQAKPGTQAMQATLS